MQYVVNIILVLGNNNSLLDLKGYLTETLNKKLNLNGKDHLCRLWYLGINSLLKTLKYVTDFTIRVNSSLTRNLVLN